MKVEFYKHNLEPEDIQRVVAVLNSLFLTTGPVTRDFEQQFAAALGVKHALGVMSCTHALFIAIKALDIGPGDEVITTPMSFMATSNACVEAGARPVFVDIEPDTGNIDANLVEAAITPRTRAILPVHLYGQMCDMRRLRAIADKHKLAIIEDCAHCIEADRDGVRPGQLGDIACFSFYATKNITSGEGGAVTTNDERLADAMRVLRLHGMTKDALNRYQSGYKHYDMERLGCKANLSDIQAALLIGQLQRMHALRDRREEICRRYERAFAHVNGVSFPRLLPNSKSARHLFTIHVDPAKRDALLARLQHKQIGVAVNFNPIHLLTFYRKSFGYQGGEFPRAERFGASTITLPMYPKLTDEEIDYVIESVKEALAGL
jgi:dTDP-4-amino-4,6-dideoxygalactose transaminase